jgi:hypothetical protein
VLPVPEGQPRQIPVPGLADTRWARFAAGGRIVVAGAARGRARRVWRLDPDGTLAPLTDEGVFGDCAVSPDGRIAALVAGDKLVLVDVVEGGPPRPAPGTFGGESVCGWHAGGDVFLRSESPPVRVRQLNLETGASTPVFDIDPPRLGRRGVGALVVSRNGKAYAYSYGQELSRLYTMTTEDPGSS